MGILNAAGAWLAGQLQTSAGVTVTYTRDGADTSLTAWVGRTPFVSETSGIRLLQWGDRDYLILASDLTVGPPKLGDRITETIDSVVHVFEVETPDGGQHHWQWSDQSHTIYRVHVKRKRVS